MLSAFGLREYQCFGERYLVRPLQVAVVAKESIPFEYSDPSLSLQMDAERDLSDVNTDKEKDLTFSSIHKDKASTELDSHSTDGTLAHHIVSPSTLTNYASPNSGDQAQPHVPFVPPVPRILEPPIQPSKPKEKKSPPVVSTTTQNSLPKPAEEKKKELTQETQSTGKPEDTLVNRVPTKNVASSQPTAPPVFPPANIAKPTPAVTQAQEFCKKKTVGKRESSNNPNPAATNEKLPNIPMKPKSLLEIAPSHKHDVSVPLVHNAKAKRKAPPSSENQSKSGLQAKKENPSSSDREGHSEENRKNLVEKQISNAEVQQFPLSVQPAPQSIPQMALGETNWTPSWFWGYSNPTPQPQETTNNILQYPYTAVSAEKAENGISSMDTTNDLRCYSPKRGPAIGVIGSGKRENEKKRERDSRFTPMFFPQPTVATPTNVNMDMMFDNTRILNATEPLDNAWDQLAGVPHSNMSPTNLSMVWPSTLEPHSVTTTPYSRPNYSQPEILQSVDFGFQAEDLYNTSSLFSSFTPLTMNLSTFHQIQPITNTQNIGNGPDSELDQEVDPNTLQFQFDTPEFLQ